MSPIPGIIASSITGGLVTESFESIATVTGTGSSNTITFSSIPQNYKHLQIRYIGKSTQSGTSARYNLNLTFNGSSSSYAWHRMTAIGSLTGGSGASDTLISSGSGVIVNSSTGFANVISTGIIDILDYTSTSKAKTAKLFLGGDGNDSGSVAVLSSGLWYATPAAITSISLAVPTGSWTTTSSFALYGIKG